MMPPLFASATLSTRAVMLKTVDDEKSFHPKEWATLTVNRAIFGAANDVLVGTRTYEAKYLTIEDIAVDIERNHNYFFRKVIYM